MPVALVTGAGRGIGRAVAYRLVTAGYTVYAADIAFPENLPCPKADLRHFIPALCDVGEEGAVRELMQRISDKSGGLDLLVNNAAVFGSEPLESLSYTRWRRILDVNLGSLFLTAKYGAPLLREKNGAIVNIASTRARMSEADTEAYSASKGGVVAMTHALAASLSPLRVNCISPGWIDTAQWSDQPQTALRAIDHAQHPAGRVGKPEDIAEAVLFLASEKSGFITGQNFIIDGGMTAKMIYEP